MLKTSLFQNSRPPGLPPKPPRPANAFPRPHLKSPALVEIHQYLHEVPIETAVLGLCEDGLPVLINFNDNQGGPILVTGDKSCGKTTLLKTLVETALAHDPAHRLLFTAITPHPETYADIEKMALETGQSLGIYEPDDEGLENHLQQIAGLIEKRARRKQAGPPLLLVIDDLKFLSTAPSQTRILLETILQGGSGMQVWTAAALQTEDCLRMGRWTRYFRTRLVGHMPNSAARRLAIFGGLDSEKLDPQRQFAVMASGKWLIFQTPGAGPKTGAVMEDDTPEEIEDTPGEEYDEDWNAVV